MAATYTLISSVTVGAGGAATISFTSIPATYTDLLVSCSTRASGSFSSAALYIKFNGSSSSYSMRMLNGNGSSASSVTDTSLYGIVPAANIAANTFGSAQFYIPNYASSNNKSVSAETVLEQNATDGIMYNFAGLWSNSAAITSIELSSNGGNFVQYSTAYLYGISNA